MNEPLAYTAILYRLPWGEGQGTNAGNRQRWKKILKLKEECPYGIELGRLEQCNDFTYLEDDPEYIVLHTNGDLTRTEYRDGAFSGQKLLGNVTKISCGIHHIIVVTQENKMYTFGSNDYTRL